ncbi:MAG: hypothetical protein KQI62_06990 [Deltaproteobacteria bacterium]|nr:hypothetical protein [Deltaproteobacteria bacterium]
MNDQGHRVDQDGVRIVVCLKQVRHRYARTGRDPQENYLAPEDEVLLVNPHDEAALNLAVDLKQQIGSGEVLALTLGPIFAPDDLNRCLALGADAFYRVRGEQDQDTWGKSLTLAGAIRSLDAAIILCGLESLDNRNGQMGAFLAQHLGLPFICAIRKVSLGSGGTTARVQRGAGRGEQEVVVCPLPAVFSVDVGAAEMRLATVPGRRKARAMACQELTPTGPAPEPMLRALEVAPPLPRGKSKPAPDADMDWYQRVDELLSGSSVDKQARFLEGDPAKLARDIVEFLVERGILEPAPERSTEVVGQ